jgi:hypothetical protein
MLMDDGKKRDRHGNISHTGPGLATSRSDGSHDVHKGAVSVVSVVSFVCLVRGPSGPRKSEKLIRIDIDRSEDVFRQWKFIECLAHNPAQAHDRFAAH